LSYIENKNFTRSFPMFQPGYAAYTQGFGTAPAGVGFPYYGSVAPTTTNIQGNFGVFQIGQRWIVPNLGEWVLLGFSSSGGTLTANWEQTASSTGDIFSLTADSGVAEPSAGTITISGGTTGLTTSVSPSPGSTMNLTGTLNVGHGGTGNTAFTAYSVITAGTTATGAFQNVSGVGTSGQYLTSNGAAALPSWQTSTPQLTVMPVAGASQAMTSNHSYIANDSALTTFTLPTSSIVGDILQIVGSALNTSGWKVTYTTNQIIWGPAGSSTVTTGNAASATAAAQSVTMVCVVANTTWVITANSGTITLT
jgi:hypothetical protein